MAVAVETLPSAVYSHGFNSTVYHATHREQLQFPGSQLVKAEESSDRFWFARWFYIYKIASALFPNNFPNFVAAQCAPERDDTLVEVNVGNLIMSRYPIRWHRLFSHIAQVDPQHAIYAAHMDLVPNKWNKVSHCECQACQQHRRFHKELDLGHLARQVAKETVKAGITAPRDDPSDYCLTKGGNLVFFEVDWFNPNITRFYLEKLVNPSLPQEMAQNYLARYHQLFELSKADYDAQLADLNCL